MHVRQHPVYTPELDGRSPLQFFAAPSGLVIHGSILDFSAENLAFETACHGRQESGRRSLSDLALPEIHSVPCKANLLTRIEDRHELESECELAVYATIPNPLARVGGEVETPEIEMAGAV